MEKKEQELLSENVDTEALMDYMEYSYLMYSLTISTEVTYTVEKAIVETVKSGTTITYECNVDFVFNDVYIGSCKLRSEPYKEKKIKKIGEIEHHSDEALILELKELFDKNPNAKKTIINYYGITTKEFYNKLKEKELKQLKRVVEIYNSEINELCEQRKEINNNIRLLRAEVAKYNKKIEDLDTGYQKRIKN